MEEQKPYTSSVLVKGEAVAHWEVVEPLTLQDAFDQKAGEAVPMALAVAAACDGHSGSLNEGDTVNYVEQLGMNVAQGHFHGQVEAGAGVDACKTAEPGQVDQAGTWKHLAR